MGIKKCRQKIGVFSVKNFFCVHVFAEPDNNSFMDANGAMKKRSAENIGDLGVVDT